MRDMLEIFFFFQAEDGIRDLVRSRGLGDVYKRQHLDRDRALEVHPLVLQVAAQCPVQTGQRHMVQRLSLIHI